MEKDLDNIAYDLQVEPELCYAITHNYDLFTVKKGKICSERVLRNIKKRAGDFRRPTKSGERQVGQQPRCPRSKNPSRRPFPFFPTTKQRRGRVRQTRTLRAASSSTRIR